jgi:hypothetical protein
MILCKLKVSFGHPELYPSTACRSRRCGTLPEVVIQPREPCRPSWRNLLGLVDPKLPMISPATDGLRLMKILDAAYKSAQTGKAVSIR